MKLNKKKKRCNVGTYNYVVENLDEIMLRKLYVNNTIFFGLLLRSSTLYSVKQSNEIQTPQLRLTIKIRKRNFFIRKIYSSCTYVHTYIYFASNLIERCLIIVFII